MWLALLLAAAPPLTTAERAQFAVPLIDGTRVMQKALAKKGVTCVPTKPFDETKPENWISPESRNGMPNAWGLIFDCRGAAGVKQLAIYLEPEAVPAPRQVLLETGPGFFLRTLDAELKVLGVGALLVFDQDKPMPAPLPGPAKGPPRAFWVVSAELGWLKLLPVEELLAILSRSAPAPAPPPTARVEVGPKESPYPSVTGPVPQLKVELTGRLSRKTSPFQQAYFSTVAARARKAVALALGRGCEVSRQVECTDATWTPSGLSPACWQTSWSCEGKPLQVWLGSNARQRENAKPLAGDVWLDVVDDYATLSVGAREAPQLTAVAPLGSVTFMGAGTAALLTKVDLAPVRELLRTAVAMPVPDAIPPQGPALAARTERRAEVRDFVLGTFARKGVEQVVLFDQTLAAHPVGSAAAALPEIDRSAFDDFTSVSASSHPVVPFGFRLPVKLLTASRQGAFFGDARKRDGWEIFRREFPKATGIIHLSEVGLSRDGTTAIIAVEWQADWLAGAGETWFLRKTANGWERLAVLMNWVS